MRFRKAQTNPTADTHPQIKSENNSDTFDKRTNSIEIPKLTKKPRKSILHNSNVNSGGADDALSPVKKSSKVAKGYTFVYPANIPIPPSEILEALYRENKLKPSKYKSPHLPMEGVAIGAVCEMEHEALRVKKEEARAYLKKLQQLEDVDVSAAVEGTLDVIREIDLMRVALKKFEKSATRATRKVRKEREELLLNQMKAKKQQDVDERLRKRELRAQEKEKRREERKRLRQERVTEMKKVFPKNVEAWREIMILQTTLVKLKKEERGWIKASIELDEKEKILEKQLAKSKDRSRRTSVMLLKTVGDDESADFEPLPDVEGMFKETVEDITLSADRITQALRGIKQLMDDAEHVKKELYHKYTTEFKFKDYFGNGSTKNTVNSKSSILDLI